MEGTYRMNDNCKYVVYVDGELVLQTDSKGYYEARLKDLKATFGQDRVTEKRELPKHLSGTFVTSY